MALPGYEKLGVFYLGREIASDGASPGAELLYDSRDLTTHAVCIGMTGSGKTGLCISLLEEAALDGIPAIVLDPKGDLGNLLLTFPELGAGDFKPWIDAGEALRKGQSIDEFAATTAGKWRDGLAQWGEDGARIKRLRESAEFTIYTPGSTAGRPLSVLRSFAAPAAGVSGDASALKERIGSSVSGLLALLGIEADPIRSREHILLSAILDAAWRNGESPDLAAIIQYVQKPPFSKVGVFDVESFYPSKERMELALRINALLAAPGFEAWLQGDVLDAQTLLYSADGRKPRVSIISIAHLNDAERMFVVTLVANELVAWMRRQPGTTSLRALFYMDEVFGYFPPTAMPPSKPPLLTLMKQARAFGIGVVLATQNPVDLDYKGLGNAGTWFIGRLQTERDKARVIDGLLSTEAAAGFDRAGLDAQLSNLAQRRFLLRNVHDDAPVLFESRWALSYLRGPLTLAEIGRLVPPAAATPGDAVDGAATAVPASSTPSASPAGPAQGRVNGAKPVVQAGLAEKYVVAPGGTAMYRPSFGAKVRAHFVDVKATTDVWREWYCLAPISADAVDWSQAQLLDEAPRFDTGPAAGATYADTGSATLSQKAAAGWAGKAADHVYRNATLEVLRSAGLKVSAAPDSTESEFRSQLALTLRERRDAAVTELRARYAKKLAALEDRARKADQKVGREQSQASSETGSAALSIAGNVLGALFSGRRGSAISKASSAARSYGRISRERADVERARSDADAVRAEIAALETEVAGAVEQLGAEYDPAKIAVDRIMIKPRKTDIVVEDIALVWSV